METTPSYPYAQVLSSARQHDMRVVLAYRNRKNIFCVLLLDEWFILGLFSLPAKENMKRFKWSYSLNTEQRYYIGKMDWFTFPVFFTVLVLL